METLDQFREPPPVDGSYRTYEEWKPWNQGGMTSHLPAFLPYLWGMETLYGRGGVASRYGSYRTYEEWKRHYDVSKKICPQVLTVPMRNGNTSTGGVSEATLNQVLTVPMRNGNIKFRRKCKHFHRFLPYLWGMETNSSTKSSSGTKSSYRTYEEWKRDLQSISVRCA